MANDKPVSYLQTDARWKSISYATKYESATIGGSGCGPTSMAMVLATWVDPSITPVTTCAWSKANGFKATGAGTYHSYFVPQAKAYGLTCEQLNSESLQYMSASEAAPIHQKAHDAIDDGKLVICLMGKGNWTSGGHYILWYSNDGDYVLINDPASTKAARVRNTFALLKSQCRKYWVITPPKEVIQVTKSEVAAMIKKEVAAARSAQLNFDVEMEKWFAKVNANPESDWSVQEGAWKKFCTMIGKNGKPIFDGSAPRGYITREQLATILNRMGITVVN